MRGDRSPCAAASLNEKLDHVVIPLFYRDRNRFIDVMRHAFVLKGLFFNTHRMILQYAVKAFFRWEIGGIDVLRPRD